jgi:hypothetical protein
MLFSQKDMKRDFISIIYQFLMQLSQTQGVSASYYQTSEIHYCSKIGLHYMHNLYFHVMNTVLKSFIEQQQCNTN